MESGITIYKNENSFILDLHITKAYKNLKKKLETELGHENKNGALSQNNAMTWYYIYLNYIAYITRLNGVEKTS